MSPLLDEVCELAFRQKLSATALQAVSGTLKQIPGDELGDKARAVLLAALEEADVLCTQHRLVTDQIRAVLKEAKKL